MNTIIITGFTIKDIANCKARMPHYDFCQIESKSKSNSITKLLCSAKSGKRVKNPFITWQPMVITGFRSQREQSQFEEDFKNAFQGTAHIISTTGEGGQWTLDKLVKGLEESSWEGGSRSEIAVTCPWCGTPASGGKECAKCGGPLGEGEKQGQMIFHRIHKAPPYDFMKMTAGLAGGFGSIMTGLAPLIIGVVFLGVALTAIKGHGSVVSTLKLTFGGIGGAMALVGGILVLRPIWKMIRR